MKRSEAVELARNVVAEGETIGDAPEATAAVIVAALEGNRPWDWDPEEPELPKRIAVKQSAAVGRSAVLTADQRWPNLALDILPGHVWWPVIEAAFDAYNRLQAGELVSQDGLLQPALDAVVRERDGLRLDCLTLREKLDAITAEKTRWAAFGHERNVHAASLEEALSRLAREAGVPDDGPDEIVGAVLAKLSKQPDIRRPDVISKCRGGRTIHYAVGPARDSRDEAWRDLRVWFDKEDA